MGKTLYPDYLPTYLTLSVTQEGYVPKRSISMVPGQALSELEYIAGIARSHIIECSAAHKASQVKPS